VNINPVAIGAAALAVFLLTRSRDAVGASSPDWREVPMPIPPPSPDPDRSSGGSGSRGSSTGGSSTSQDNSHGRAVRRFQAALQAYLDDRGEFTPSLPPEADGVIGRITAAAWNQFLQDVRAIEYLAARAESTWPTEMNRRLLPRPRGRTQDDARRVLGSTAPIRTLRRNLNLVGTRREDLEAAANYIQQFRERIRAGSSDFLRYVSQLGAAL
jgi:hypothetical protein